MLRSILLAVCVCTSLFSYDKAVMHKILERYEETASDALIIEIDGEVVVKKGEDELFETMSITKSVVGLLVGVLCDQGKLTLDTPIASIYEKWNTEERKAITIRHILSHTSGLETFESLEEMYLISDAVEEALKAPYCAPPGERFLYNNRVVNLLAGVVYELSGKQLDAFAEEVLFAPLHIETYEWRKDANDTPLCLAGLELKPSDLLKIGRLVNNKGKWEGKQLISEEWITRCLTPSQEYNSSSGFLWWINRDDLGSWPESLLQTYERVGMPQYIVDKLRALEGRPIKMSTARLQRFFGSLETYKEFARIIKSKRVGHGRIEKGDVVGYNAHGYLGQFLVLMPEHNIVAVRHIRHGKVPDNEVDDFDDLVDLVFALPGV